LKQKADKSYDHRIFFNFLHKDFNLNILTFEPNNMTSITFKGTPVHTLASLPAVGSTAIDFQLSATDLSTKTLADFKGETLIISTFPSLETSVCSLSVKQFNERVADIENTRILCVSRDLPFAQSRFSEQGTIENITFLSDFKTHQFGKDYGLEMLDGPLAGLLSRCVIVINPNGTVLYTEQVPEVAEEPNYTAAFDSLQ
jgi:thiol peroxidase